MGESWLDELEELFGEKPPPTPAGTAPGPPKKEFHSADPNQPAFIQKCPLCESPMAERNGKNGLFLGCKKYPGCKGTRNYPK